MVRANKIPYGALGKIEPDLQGIWGILETCCHTLLFLIKMNTGDLRMSEESAVQPEGRDDSTVCAVLIDWKEVSLKRLHWSMLEHWHQYGQMKVKFRKSTNVY